MPSSPVRPRAHNSSLVAVRRFAGAGPADGGLKGLKLQDDLTKVLGRLAQILDDKLGFDLAFTGRQVLVGGQILVEIEIAGKIDEFHQVGFNGKMFGQRTGRDIARRLLQRPDRPDYTAANERQQDQ